MTDKQKELFNACKQWEQDSFFRYAEAAHTLKAAFADVARDVAKEALDLYCNDARNRGKRRAPTHIRTLLDMHH